MSLVMKLTAWGEPGQGFDPAFINTLNIGLVLCMYLFEVFGNKFMYPTDGFDRVHVSRTLEC